MPLECDKKSIRELHQLLESKEISARELASFFLENIEKKNKDINAYIEVYEDVLENADLAQKKIDDGEARALTGIPIAIKDNILIEGKLASAASNILKNYKAPYDAYVIKKLKKEGAVFLGRTNMDEFAMGSSTENSVFGVVKNPLDFTRVAGGSSGGAAAAVAMGGATAALGSDTGGSVRQPASFCGVVGLKPTYGSVSRSGLIAMGSSLDVIGPITKSVDDAEILFEAIKGRDIADSTSMDFKDDLMADDKNIRISGMLSVFTGISGYQKISDISEDVLANYEKTLKALGQNFKMIDEKFEVEEIKYSLPVYYIIMPAEASTNLARFDGIKYGLHVSGENIIDDYFKTRGQGFGKEVRRRIMLGSYVLSSGYYDAYYDQARNLRAKITSSINKVFEKVDVLVTPTTPSPAFKIGEKVKNPIEMYLADIFTVTANISGHPAISIPSGKSHNMPLGIQLLARHGQEKTLFKVARKFMELNN